jgi:pimeloyl-ACP methyl ester carboxylesterase
MFRGLRARTKLSRTFTSHVLGVPMGQLTSAMVVKQVFAPEPVPEDFGTRGGGLLALRPANINASSFEISAANEEMTRIARRYRELKLPVSLLFGREDRVLDHHLNGVVTTEHIPQATLDLVEGGHMLPVTQPERTAAFVRAAAA